MTGFKEGLEGVPVAQSSICKVDGENGRLYYRGYPIEDLAARSNFEEVVHLLWYGELPRKEDLELFRGDLKRHALGLLGAYLTFLMGATRETVAIRVLSSMEMLRTIASLPPRFSDEKDDNDLARHLLVTFPIVTAVHHRIKNGQSISIIRPSYNLSVAGNFLFMLRGEFPKKNETLVLDRALVLHAEHSMNASTFTARVITSTGSDMRSAITGAIGALKGSLHGGANKDAIDLFEEIAAKGMDTNAIDAFIVEKLKRKEKIPGCGHRVYKVIDPRAVILKKDVESLLNDPRDTKLFEIAEVVRKTVEREKGKYPNVDFYSGLLYRTLGIPSELFIPIFAISRTAGWVAHIFEQRKDNRIIRPTIDYIGVWPPRPYPKRKPRNP